ncbi:MAG: 4'-phosphopantetheinyl transferase superfamily protein [Actinobacteria bacterium]|nr:4'-phosphopantetheinyl transferase superfamily protein [Actinomycetota bacterium]
MIEKILPAEVACAEAFDDPPEAVLYPEEEAVISRAVDKRRREFRTVRHCARRALRELGIPPVALLPGERGMPQWPPGVVGSMTHCAGYRAAAVARSRDLLTVGIDAEPHDVLPRDVLGYVALDEEQARLAELAAADNGTCWDRLLFCIKETVYKAWFPLTRQWLGFEDAAVIIDPGTVLPSAAGAFAARLLVAGPTIAGEPLTGFHGRWLVGDGLVIASIAVAATSVCR